jgi:hypothetical protein
MRGGKGEQKSSETLGLLFLFFLCIDLAMVLFKKSFWKILQHFFFFLQNFVRPELPSGAPRPPALGPRAPRSVLMKVIMADCLRTP